jgi:hypothetical protein
MNPRVPRLSRLRPALLVAFWPLAESAGTMRREVPSPLRLAKGPNENDRLIEVYRVY